MRTSTDTGSDLVPLEDDPNHGFVSIVEAAALTGIDRQDVEALLLRGVIQAVVHEEPGKPSQWLVPMDEVVLLHLESNSSWSPNDPEPDIAGRPELSAAVRAVVAHGPKPTRERSERVAALLTAGAV